MTIAFHEPGTGLADGVALAALSSAWEMTPEQLREAAAASPFAFAARLLGVTPLLVERQPIRPTLGGRSFASNRAFTPLHTDSQMFLGMPATLQVLICVQPARSGGESVFVDGAALADHVAQADPELATALFEVDRVQRFYFGEVTGPTIAMRGGHLTWTCSPNVADDVGRGLARVLDAHPKIVHALRPGEALLASNHRMLHGRQPFEGDRELVRLLVWLEQPLAFDPQHRARAREITPPHSPETLTRVRSVLAILRGVPPAKVAHEAQVSEATLYAWRDTFFTQV